MGETERHALQVRDTAKHKKGVFLGGAIMSDFLNYFFCAFLYFPTSL